MAASSASPLLVIPVSGASPVPSPPASACRDGQPPNEAGVGSRKRKVAPSQVVEELFDQPVVIKPHPANVTVQPRVLRPLMILPREHLPLSCLDLASPHGHLPASGLGGSSQFVESSIRALDLESRVGTRPVVLVARSETSGLTYAIERHDGRLYVACKLGSWVDVDALRTHATACAAALSRQQPEAGVSRPPEPTAPQLFRVPRKKSLAIEAIQSLVRKKAKSPPHSPTLTPLTLLPLPPSPSRTFPPLLPISAACEGQRGQLWPRNADVDVLDTHCRLLAPDAADSVGQCGHGRSHAEGMQQPATGVTGGEILENIRKQYFEALYKSKGSLAYFAKGPLSRARAAFYLDSDSNLDVAELVEFLKTLVLTTAQIDVKYRETVPEIMRQAKAGLDSADDNVGRAKRRRSKSKSKPTKVGRNGLYPDEDGLVHGWWAARAPEEPLLDGSGHADDDSVTRPELLQQQKGAHVAVLRTRETQLQIILILEILALEPVRAAAGSAGLLLPTLPGQSAVPALVPLPPLKVATSDDGAATARPAMATAKAAKLRKQPNLPLLLDVHADRLSIWQSTSWDDLLPLRPSAPADRGGREEGGVEGSADVGIGGGGEMGGGDASSMSTGTSGEVLRDFCVDIIVPFFSARLPELCQSLNRKFGGPIAHLGPTTKAIKPARACRPSTAVDRHRPQPKPGAAVTRSAHTLRRALSCEQSRRSVSRGPGSAIALMRSATSSSSTASSAVPLLRRERTDPVGLQSASQALLNARAQTGRPLLAQSRSKASFASVSTTAAAATTQEGGARAQKQAMIEFELHDAISALRKPNRVLAGKAVVEEAEKRGAMASPAPAAVRSSKPRRTVTRPRLPDGVQVQATPATTRFRDVAGPECVEPHSQAAGRTPRRDRDDGMDGYHDDAPIPPSSVSHVPATGPRPSGAHDLLGRVRRLPPLPATPTAGRRSLAALPPASSSPIPAHRLVVAATPATTTSAVVAAAGMPRVSAMAAKRSLFQSPLRRRSVAVASSLYSRLGWDNDDDEPGL